MFKIYVKTLQGNIYNYHVDSYTNDKGIIRFKDKKTDKIKRYAVANCEIEEMI